MISLLCYVLGVLYGLALARLVHPVERLSARIGRHDHASGVTLHHLQGGAVVMIALHRSDGSYMLAALSPEFAARFGRDLAGGGS